MGWGETMSNLEGWKYYNHAAIPTTPPHITPNIAPVESGEIWKIKGALLARWTSDFDCEQETSFWYVIMDHPFDISCIKAKRRYEINKGIKNYTVRVIDLEQYKEEIFSVWAASLEGYSDNYRPNIHHDEFVKWISTINDHTFYAAFNNETNEIEGIALLSTGDEMKNFSALKTIPSCEKKGINAALVFGMLNDNADFLSGCGYICDGARNIYHQTNFQDYLEKYFCFRKAYCILNVKYKVWLGIIIQILYKFRKVLKKYDSKPFFHKINALLQLEEMRRGEE